MHRYLSTALLSAALLMPTVVRADEHPRRYYDRDRRDWHEWNEREEQAYRHYLQERNREYREHQWERARREQQREYWRWRHEHPNSLLWPDRR